MRTRNALLLVSLLGFGLLLGGCHLDNGLPEDVVRLCAQHGVRLTSVERHAPLLGREGAVVTQLSPQAFQSLMKALKLDPIESDSRLGRHAIATTDRLVDVASSSIRALWGATGRPGTLKLKNGAQFEFLFVVVMEDERLILVASYAYS